MREDSDDVLLTELADVLDRMAAPPPDLVRQSRELYAWRTVDAELAQLVHDSLLDSAPVGVRSGQQPRTLTFETDALLIEVEVDDTVGARRLIGQLVPATAASLEVRTTGGDEPAGGGRSGVADEFGRFVLELPARRGLVSIRCTLPDGSGVETSWETL